MSKQLKEKTMKYGELTLGQVEAVVNKFGGMEGVQRFLSGELRVSATAKVWKTWKTIKLGTGLQTADDFRKAVKSAGMKIGDWANDVLGKSAFTTTTHEMEVELVLVSVAELGFRDGATRKEIYVRAQELGLDLCPPEVGPQLRLQYTDQPKSEWLVIAMEPITDSGGGLNLFSVKHDDDERWLNANNGNPDNVWNGNNCFVFLRRKSFHFSPTFVVGEFCFVSCPFHPPSILPTSSILRDTAIYFLLSIDFVSHKTRRSILSVSTFRIAIFTQGSFSP